MKRKKFTVLTIAGFIILIIGIVVLSQIVQKYRPTDERADIEEYFGSPSGEQLSLVIDNEVVGAEGMILDGSAYIEYEAVVEYLNERFYWDTNENLLLYTLPTEVVSAGTGSKDYYIAKKKSSEKYVIVKAEGADTYIAIDFIKKYTDLEYEIYQDPGRIVITSDWGKTDTAVTKNETEIREKGGIKSYILKTLDKKEKVIVLEEEDNWLKVKSSDGFIGYIQKKAISDRETVDTSQGRDFDEPDFSSIAKDYTINMAWHQVTNKSANKDVLTTIASTKGLTTLSPTWFSIKDNDGNVNSLASEEYVNYAHQSDIEVWGLIDNFNEDIDTHGILSSTSKRETLGNQIVALALQYDLDGINVDFENIEQETGEHYIQFIRELSVKCRNNGIVLSVDNYVPQSYTSHYNRKEQGIFADYVVIMGYDEHYAGSEESGPVASIGFVRDGIEKTLEEVPAEKVINAMPFYTRLWKEAGSDEKKVTSEVFGMDNAKEHIESAREKHNAAYGWNEESGQYYLEYTTEEGVFKMWQEEEKSIEEKLKVMKEYNLAGAAEWKLGLESKEIWDVILKYVN